MKVSLAAQGWKALAAKLHGQLPLSPKESQRLLTALTTSFRKHLDDVHPTSAHDVGLNHQAGPSLSTRSNKQTLHSSATFADNHMAAILTGPLLSGKSGNAADRRLESARRELDGGVHPFEVLETFQKQGHCETKVAALCVRQYLGRVGKLKFADRVPALQMDEASSRILRWLWTTGQYKDPHFIDEHAFRRDVVAIVMREGREEILWEWLKLDEKIAVKSSSTINVNHWEGSTMSPFLWKGRLLRSMVEEALMADRTTRSAIPALNIFLRAFAMQRSGRRLKTHMAWLPCDPARVALFKALQDHKGTPYNLPADRFDDFLTTYSTIARAPGLDFDRAILMLHSTSQPDSRPLCDVLSRCLGGDREEDHDSHYTSMLARHWQTEFPPAQQMHLMLHAVAVLRLDEQFEHADDFLQLVRIEHPEAKLKMEPEIASMMRRIRSRCLGMQLERSDETEQELMGASREARIVNTPHTPLPGKNAEGDVSIEEEMLEASRRSRAAKSSSFPTPGYV
ncbi:hypothetical protein B0A48_06581 [Cryoendolithus antarcticus]|uniref:Uncharacterized protein n=1 Tax=Cryoendolithus antarcticus TaxID=1507870 RepID=A0A1V8T8W1_9PEZI|nr:hypothetical protein B0A48_06581 [Cryoendolithus antarcticus]